MLQCLTADVERVRQTSPQLHGNAAKVVSDGGSHVCRSDHDRSELSISETIGPLEQSLDVMVQLILDFFGNARLLFKLSKQENTG